MEFKWIASVFPVWSSTEVSERIRMKKFLALDSLQSCRREDQFYLKVSDDNIHPS
jgi:hypothetical protein